MTLKLDRQAYYWPGLIGFAILFVANFVANPIFVQPDNWLPVLLGAAPFIITTWAETVPILSGNGDLDLSVGPLAGLVNAVVAFTLPAWGITDPVSMIVIALAIGVASGLLNGFLVTIVRVQPIIATLGTF
ncbi:MAG: ABC transporter permease, partial [Stellaceae bacterium]